MTNSLAVVSSVSIISLTLVTGEVSAEVTGGSGCFNCPPPDDIANALEQSFNASDPDELARQAWSGSICDHHPCTNDFGVVDEQEAKDFYQDFRGRQLRKEDRWLSWIGIALGLISTCAAVYAVFQTYLSKSVATDADARVRELEIQLAKRSETAR